MNNHSFSYRFGMYEPSTDSVIINTGKLSALVIQCQKYNSSIVLNDPLNIVFLHRLAEETPLLYAELALKKGGLQGYVDAMNEFN